MAELIHTTVYFLPLRFLVLGTSAFQTQKHSLPPNYMCLQFSSRGLWFNSGIISIRLKARSIAREMSPLPIAGAWVCWSWTWGSLFGMWELRRECHAGLITLWVPYYVSGCHFQFEPPHCNDGPWLFLIFLFWLWLDSDKYAAHSEQRKGYPTVVKNADHMFSISIGWGVVSAASTPHLPPHTHIHTHSPPHPKSHV